MAQIETAPQARSRRGGTRSGSPRPRLVLVPPLPSEPGAATGLPLELAAAVIAGMPPDAEAATGPPPGGTTGLAGPSRRTVPHGSVPARQLLPTPPVPARGRPHYPPAPAPSRAEQWESSQAAPVWWKSGAPPVRRPTGLPLRLTTRGRIVVVAILVAPLLVMLSLLFRSQVDASSDPTAPRPYPVIVVQPGDTLWTIAGRVAPDGDRRAVIHQIREINGLSSASIQAGQRLAVPLG